MKKLKATHTRLKFYEKKFLVDRDFQLSFVKKIGFLIFMITGFLYLGFKVLFYRFNLLGETMGLESDHFYYHFLKEHSENMDYLFLAILVPALITVAIYSYYLSHCIAGPLENVKINLKKIEDAIDTNNLHEIEEIKFRKNDFFHHFATAFNRHIKVIKKREKSSAITHLSDKTVF